MKRKKVLVIGGTGHIGSYLIPSLVAREYEVVVFSRGKTSLYPESFWEKEIKRITVDREKEEKTGHWQALIEETRADIIVDIICFEPESAQILIDTLTGKDVHLLSCGTVWVYGKTRIVPTPEAAPRFPENDYARKKAIIEDKLLQATREGKIQATVIHPGHITGPGKTFVTPFGDHNPETLQKIIEGKEIYLLDGGFSTLHHVHPQDVASLFLKAIEKESKAIGDSFNCGASEAMTFWGLGEYFASLFGKEFYFQNISLEEYTEKFGYPEEAAQHVRQGCCVSMLKAQEVLDFTPRYSAREAVASATDDLIKRGILKVNK